MTKNNQLVWIAGHLVNRDHIVRVSCAQGNAQVVVIHLSDGFKIDIHPSQLGQFVPYEPKDGVVVAQSQSRGHYFLELRPVKEKAQ